MRGESRSPCIILVAVAVLSLAGLAGATLTAPQPLLPDNGKRVSFYDNVLCFDWEPVEGASGYNLHISDDPSFPYDNFSSGWISDDNFTLQLGELQRGATYYWRVQARDNENVEGENSSWRYFKLNRPPTASNLLIDGKPSPATRVSTNPVFSWSYFDPDGDPQLGIEIRVTTSPGTWESPLWLFAPENYTSNSKEYPEYAPSLVRGVLYYVRVLPRDSVGDWALEEQAVCGQFCPNQLPKAENLKIDGMVNPGCLVDFSPTFSWNYCDLEGDPQSHFQVWVGTKEGWRDMWDSGEIAGENKSVLYGGQPLSPGRKYYVQVRVKDGLEWSEWCTGWFRMNSAPVIREVKLNNGAQYTNSPLVTLTVNASDNEGEVTYMWWGFDQSSLTQRPYSSTL
ncbi:MAG: hypothetical protein QXR87_02775, partial [Candidatus Hadarchaeales archaeon]